MSLELIGVLDIQPSMPVIDVGGGASLLVDHLAQSEFNDLTVLDLSEVALEDTRRRLKDHPRSHSYKPTSCPGSSPGASTSGTTGPCSTSSPTTGTGAAIWPP